MSMQSRVMVTNARLAFPTLEKPEQFQGQGKERYSAVLLIEPGSPSHEACKAAMRAAAAEKWGDAKADAAVKGLTSTGKVAMYDGDVKADNYDGFEGMIAISAHSQATAPPVLLDGQKNQLPRNTGVIYPGCYVNASIEFWAQDNQFGKRINAQLRGVQFAKDGDSFSAARPADSDEFGVVEGAVASSADFGADAAADAGEFA